MSLINSEDLDTSPPDWLVDGMIPLAGIGFVWGPSRAGKSLLTNGELALAVANGTEFFGRATAAGPVAVCLGEGAYDAGVRRLARIARERNDRLRLAAEMGDAETGAEWLDELAPYTGEDLYFMPEPFILPLENGGEPSGSLRAARDVLAMVQPVLVILDALSDFTPSLSISNDASANRSVQGMKWLARELSCALLAVAHPVRDGSRMLGAGRLFNAADFVIRVQPDEAYGGHAAGATVTCEKNKYGEPFEPFGYSIEKHAWHSEDGRLTKSATIRQREAVSAPARRKSRPLPEFIEQSTPRRTGLRAV